MYSIGSNCIHNVYRSIPEHLKEKALKESIFRRIGIGTVVITTIFYLISKLLHTSLDVFILTSVIWLICDNAIRSKQ